MNPMRTFTVLVVLVAAVGLFALSSPHAHRVQPCRRELFERLYQQLQSLLSILLGSPYVILSPSTARSGLLLG